MSGRKLTWIGPLIVGLGVPAVVTYVLAVSREAQQVAIESAFLLFTIFTTPFILESTVAVLGLTAVLTYNQWRLAKEGDEWVEMEVPVAANKESQEN